MIPFISVTIGVIISVFSLMMIRKEVMKASFFKNVQVSSNQPNDLIPELQSLESKVDEMNQAFYDIVSDLEGKYSVHDKEMQLLDDQLNTLKDGIDEIKKCLQYQGEAIHKIHVEEVMPAVEEKTLVAKAESRKMVQEDSKDLRDEIIRLQSLGYDDQQIAKQLNKGIREINILMKLKN